MPSILSARLAWVLRNYTMNKLFLLRHGENHANLTKELSCKHIDYPLNEKGRLQARQTGKFLRERDIRAIYTSPLKRAAETAEIVGNILGLIPILSEAFREINVGDLERRSPSQEAWSNYFSVIDAWTTGYTETAFPNGEDYHQLWDRYQGGILEVCQSYPHQNILIVGHGGIFTMTLPLLCPEINLEDLMNTENHNTAITEVDVVLEDGVPKGKLIDWANTSHLSGKAAELVPGLPKKDDFAP